MDRWLILDGQVIGVNTARLEESAGGRQVTNAGLAVSGAELGRLPVLQRQMGMSPPPTPESTSPNAIPIARPAIFSEQARREEAEYQVLIMELQLEIDSLEHWSGRYEVELSQFQDVREEYLEAIEQADEETRQKSRVRINGHERDYDTYQESLTRAEELWPEFESALTTQEDAETAGELNIATKAATEMLPIAKELSDLYWEMQVDLSHMTWDMDVIIGWLAEE